MSTSTPAIVSLYSYAGAGFIVKASTNVVYRSSAGAVGAGMMSCEGFFVPVTGAVNADLIKLSTGSPDHLGEEQAEGIDSVLRGAIDTEFLRVDRSKLKESFEGWVHVTLSRDASLIPILVDEAHTSAVLIWENAD